MLEAIDIVLICLGTVLSIFASIAIFLLLILKRRKLQGKSPGSSAKVAAAKEYYLDHPPTISAAAKNGEAPRFVSRPSATNVPVRIDDNQKAETKDSGIKESSVIRVEEHSEIRSHEEIHRSSNSIKRSHRPCRIKLSPDLAKAAQAEAVQSEHTLDNFMKDLSRIRSEDDAVLYEEFQILEELDSVRERNCSAAEKERTRNRFVDILPSDSTRVILHGSNDYINASLIDGYRTAGQFIATQGPIGPEEATDGRKKSTVDDFWRMIWEKNVQCIIMLTDCVENMRQRCSKYWPSLGEVQRFGEVEVDMISESEDPICLHREFDIKKNGERRQISQYHFLNWYDAKGPENAAYLLDFIERIWHKQYRKPIVVHCSAGVGRTGVLIALWILLERARQERKVDIFATVDTLRRQRSRMVQTPEQYLTLYEAVSLAIAEDRIR